MTGDESRSKKKTLVPQETKEDHTSEIIKLKKELLLRTELARVVSTFTSPEELLPNVLAVLCNGFGATGGAIFFMERDSPEIVLKASYGLDPSYAVKYQKINIGNHVTGKVAQTGEGVLIDDSKEDERSTRKVVDMLKYRSAVVTPVTSKDEVVGITALISMEPKFFTQKDLKMLEFMSAHISLAIVNSFLNQDIAEERTKTLNILEKVDEGIFQAEMKEAVEISEDLDAMLAVFKEKAFFTLLNKSFVKQCGVDTAVGASVNSCFEEGWSGRMLREVLEKGEVMGIERRWIGEEERFFEVSMVRMDHDMKVKGVKGIRRDVTARVKMEEKVKQGRVQTEMYLDNMSHDLTNINTALLGNLEMILAKSNDDKDLVKYVRNSLEAVYRSTSLIRRVRTLSKIMKEPKELIPVDLSEAMVRNFDTVKKEFFRRTVKLDIVSEQDTCMVRVDHMLDELMQNIIRNSIASNQGETIEITVNIKEWTYNNVNGYLISFSDKGTGTSEGVKESIFELKEMEDAAMPRSGLGLAVVNGIAERYGGKVWIEDRVKGDPSAGARFMIFLPVA